MATKKYKPTSPGNRTRQVLANEDITTSTPEKSLVKRLVRRAGRNNQGKLTVRHKGGGVKRLYREIDFKRADKSGYGVVETIEYDPNRSVNISLIKYFDGSRSYILCPQDVKVGQKIYSGSDVEISNGNALPLSNIPTGILIHNIELKPGKGGQIARSAGSYAVLMAKASDYVTVKLPSGEVRLIDSRCRATIGQLANSDRRNTTVGKAGINRKKGIRPTVRGSVMNPCDHPHGGGEGRAPVGRSGPMTPWGKPTLGYKTRNRKNKSSKFIVRRRKK